KMSKSLGNVVSPLAMKDVYGLEAFRYFLCREMSFGHDASFNETALVDRLNADLANDLGNLFARVLAMAKKYFQGEVPAADAADLPATEIDLAALAAETVAAYEANLTTFYYARALSAVWELIGAMNRYVDYTAPWELAKSEEKRPTLAAVMYQLLEGLRVVAGLIYPVMPDTAATMMAKLGLAEDKSEDQFDFEKIKTWGGLPPGARLGKPPALFPRVEKPETAASAAAEAGQPPAAPGFKAEIDIDTFARTDLRIGTVLTAEKIPRAKKLLRLEVDIGEKRTVVAGIAEAYTPEEMVGRQVVIVANLKPAKLMGVESHGMLLAAFGDKGAALATVDNPVDPGTVLK
ncbi:MAG: methionine--tRNA ligase subunit beta, partial [Desulfosudaceae bacterium]